LPENGADIFLRNAWLPRNYTSRKPGRPYSFFLMGWDECTWYWATVPNPDDRWWWWWLWSSRWNANWQGKPKYSEKTDHSIILPNTNPTWPDLGLNVGRRGGKQGLTAWVMHDTAQAVPLLQTVFAGCRE
jgi:hypothetical protein